MTEEQTNIKKDRQRDRQTDRQTENGPTDRKTSALVH